MLRRAGFIAAVSCVVLCRGASSSAADAPPPSFARDVLPILAKHCFACHGPDAGHREADLRLDVRESAVAPLPSGATAVVPRRPERSELVARLTSTDADLRMPPTKHGPPLPAAQIEVLRRWIAEGASYAKHWAYVAPTASAPPPVKNAAWVVNDVDRFILAQLEHEGLTPNDEADSAVLHRRLYLDLTGLPPTPDEVRGFVRAYSARSADREKLYAQLVDRLLASPRFGERWARPWLDLARYADSRGYGSDPLRLNIWPYRDWVIGALNRDLPYDRFLTWQLAGDLLPNASVEQRTATAFHRNTMTNTEGGTDDEEFRVAAVHDRTAVTLQAFMGLTMGCAKCHSHKYDPLTQTDYYRTFAVFNQTEDTDRADEFPTLPVDDPDASAKQKQREKLQGEIAALKKQIEADAKALAPPADPKSQPQTKPATTAKPEVETKAAAAASKTPAAKPEAKTSQTAGKAKPAAGAEAAQAATAQAESAAKAAAVKLEKLRQDAEKRKTQLAALERSLAAIKPLELPVLRELPQDKRRPTHILVKGNFLAKGEPVEPGLPAAFHAPPPGPIDRSALARWIMARENPLTARVAVNRMWAQLFGVGLVETEEDFGVQGALPSHPELLDWLAVQFMDGAAGGPPWSQKALLRLLVTSRTYRQSSRTSLAAAARDPRNRLLSHAPRFRLDAETVRDQALAIAGLLSSKIGGPSVFPPQPAGMWQAAFNGERTWSTSAGDDKYRRGLYTFWRRTVPYPSMATFDAPSREICAVRRIRTNTPLQALVTLNDPVYVEAAQALARRIVREGGSSDDERLRYALLLCTGRPARDEQTAALAALLADELRHYRADRAAAKPLATEPLGPLPPGLDEAEAAAWTVVANVLLNLDAVLTRG